MWLLNRSDVNLTTRLSVSPDDRAHSIRHKVSVDADWFKAAPVVLHLTWNYTNWDSNSTEDTQWSVDRPFSQSEFIHRVNYGSGLPGSFCSPFTHNLLTHFFIYYTLTCLHLGSLKGASSNSYCSQRRSAQDCDHRSGWDCNVRIVQLALLYCERYHIVKLHQAPQILLLCIEKNLPLFLL